MEALFKSLDDKKYRYDYDSYLWVRCCACNEDICGYDDIKASGYFKSGIAICEDCKKEITTVHGNKT